MHQLNKRRLSSCSFIFWFLLLIIQQKSCQNNILLIISKMLDFEAGKECADSHDLRAESHTLHNFCYKTVIPFATTELDNLIFLSK